MLRTRPFALFCLIVPIALPIAVWLLIAATSVNVPYWDEWEWADLVYRFHVGTLTFNDLWSQHNEHRLLFPQLILLGLDRFGGWSPVREQFVSLFFVVLTQIGLFAIVRRTLHGYAALVTGALASIVLYGLWQAENFTWGFQMAWFMCNAGAVAVAALLSRARRPPAAFAAAVVVATIASFSSSQGLIAWAVGAVAIVTMQRNAARLLPVWLVLAAIVYKAYSHGLGASSVDHFNIFARPLTALHYVLAYLGSPIARSYGVNPSSVAGAFVLGGIGAALFADLRGPYRRRHFLRRGAWYAIATFPVACALATATGRATLGLAQALASRYTTVSGLAWIAAIGIGASFAAQFAPRLRIVPQRTAILVAGSVCATLAALIVYRSEVDGWGQWDATESTWAGARRELEHDDPAALSKLYPQNARIEMLIDELRKVHDGPLRNG